MSLYSCLTFIWAKYRVRVRVRVSQFVLAPIPLRPTDVNLCFSTEPLRLYSLCNILSDERMCLSAVILGSGSRGTHDHILLSQIRDSPNLEGQVPVFISPRNRVAQLYPHTLGPLFVAYYDSQG
jgi:hypothetical protein